LRARPQRAGRNARSEPVARAERKAAVVESRAISSCADRASVVNVNDTGQKSYLRRSFAARQESPLRTAAVAPESDGEPGGPFRTTAARAVPPWARSPACDVSTHPGRGLPTSRAGPHARRSHVKPALRMVRGPSDGRAYPPPRRLCPGDRGPRATWRTTGRRATPGPSQDSRQRRRAPAAARRPAAREPGTTAVRPGTAGALESGAHGR
jgi:hypothetical protein